MGGIGEIHGPVGLDDNVVRAVEPLTFVTIDHRRRLATGFERGDSTRTLIADHEPALSVERESVRGASRCGPRIPDRPDLAVGVPPVDSVPSKVTEDQVWIRGAYPDRTFDEPESTGQLLDRRCPWDDGIHGRGQTMDATRLDSVIGMGSRILTVADAARGHAAREEDGRASDRSSDEAKTRI